MLSLRITISDENNGVRVIQISGYADGSSVDNINQAVQKILQANPHCDFVLAGSHLSFVNSTFIGCLTGWFTSLEKNGHRIVLAELLPQALDTLKTVGMLAIIPHFSTTVEAQHFLTATQKTTKPVTG